MIPRWLPLSHWKLLVTSLPSQEVKRAIKPYGRAQSEKDAKLAQKLEPTSAVYCCTLMTMKGRNACANPHLLGSFQKGPGILE
jgi:hypothetical protein